MWLLRLAAVLCAHKISWIFKRINFGRRAETYNSKRKSHRNIWEMVVILKLKTMEDKDTRFDCSIALANSPHGICNNKNRNSMPHTPRLRFAECNLAAMLRVYIHTCP